MNTVWTTVIYIFVRFEVNFYVIVPPALQITVLQLSTLLKQADSSKRKLTLTRLASAPVPFTVLSLTGNPCNEDYLAVCGLKVRKQLFTENIEMLEAVRIVIVTFHSFSF